MSINAITKSMSKKQATRNSASDADAILSACLIKSLSAELPKAQGLKQSSDRLCKDQQGPVKPPVHVNATRPPKHQARPKKTQSKASLASTPSKPEVSDPDPEWEPPAGVYKRRQDKWANSFAVLDSTAALQLSGETDTPSSSQRKQAKRKAERTMRTLRGSSSSGCESDGSWEGPIAGVFRQPSDTSSNTFSVLQDEASWQLEDNDIPTPLPWPTNTPADALEQCAQEEPTPSSLPSNGACALPADASDMWTEYQSAPTPSPSTDAGSSDMGAQEQPLTPSPRSSDAGPSDADAESEPAPSIAHLSETSTCAKCTPEQSRLSMTCHVRMGRVGQLALAAGGVACVAAVAFQLCSRRNGGAQSAVSALVKSVCAITGRR